MLYRSRLPAFAAVIILVVWSALVAGTPVFASDLAAEARRLVGVGQGVQVEDPGAGAVLPTLQAAQAVGEKAPVPFQALPAGQSLQNVDPSPLEYVPGAQEVQLEAGKPAY